MKIKPYQSMLLGVLFALLCTGCAGSLKSFSPQLTPVSLKDMGTQPIKFTGVNFEIPVGKDVGSFYDGLAKVKKDDHLWEMGFSVGANALLSHGIGVLTENGYDVVNKGDELFGEEANPKNERYQLGAVITDLTHNSFSILAGNYNESIVVATFKLYDMEKESVVYEYSTDAHAKIKNKQGNSIFVAFQNALRNLLAQKEFTEFLKK